MRATLLILATLAATGTALFLGLALRYGWLRLLEWRRRVL